MGFNKLIELFTNVQNVLYLCQWQCEIVADIGPWLLCSNILPLSRDATFLKVHFVNFFFLDHKNFILMFLVGFLQIRKEGIFFF